MEEEERERERGGQAANAEEQTWFLSRSLSCLLLRIFTCVASIISESEFGVKGRGEREYP